MRVFISSVITGYEEFRAAAAAAIISLGHEVVRAEDFGALSHTPQQACLRGVRTADVVVLLIGGRYGAVQPSGLSATHEEYREARESKPLLVFVERGITREPDQARFLTEVQGWDGGRMTQDFSRAEELRGAATRQLHRLELAQQAGTTDPEEMKARAVQLVPDERGHSYKTSLVVAIVGGPRQSILRPSMIESEELYESLLQRASFGAHRIFDTRQGTQRVIRDDALRLEQPDASIYLNEEGSIRIVVPARDPESAGQSGLSVIIHEEIEEGLVRILGTVSGILDHIDPTHRIARVAIAAALHGGGMMGWRTRAEHAVSPNSVTVNMRDTGGSVIMSPPDRARGALQMNSRDIATDLAIHLRRKHQN